MLIKAHFRTTRPLNVAFGISDEEAILGPHEQLPAQVISAPSELSAQSMSPVAPSSPPKEASPPIRRRTRRRHVKMRQLMELKRQQLLVNRRSLRIREAQFQVQRRHYMAIERSFNTHIQQQRVIMEQMMGSHAALQQVVDILGQATLLMQGKQNEERVEDVSATPFVDMNGVPPSDVRRPGRRVRRKSKRGRHSQP